MNLFPDNAHTRGKCLKSGSMVLSVGDFAPRGQMAMTEDILGCHKWGWG